MSILLPKAQQLCKLNLSSQVDSLNVFTKLVQIWTLPIQSIVKIWVERLMEISYLLITYKKSYKMKYLKTILRFFVKIKKILQ